MTLALVALYDATAAVLAVDAPDVRSFFGWRTPAEVKEQDLSICWVPGDPTGKVGKLQAPAQPGLLPTRPLSTLVEAFHVVCHGVDRANHESEIHQYSAARCLFDTWFRAMYAAAFQIGTGGRIEVLDLSWYVDRKLRPDGAALRAICTIQASIRDTPGAIAIEPTAEMDGEMANDIEPLPNGEDPFLTETLTVTREEIES